MSKRVLSSLEETKKLAQEILPQLKEKKVLLLSGDLGSGKTTFTKALAKELGVEEEITSPTFTIASEYSAGNFVLAHVDLYRLAENAAHDPAVVDVLERMNDENRLTVIEWAEYLGEAAPQGALHLSFAHGETEQSRIVTIN